MTKSFFRGLVAVLLLLQSNIIQAQSGQFYRSRQTGEWATASTWESSGTASGTYATATVAPNATANTILIQSGHTVTITSDITLDETTIAAGAVLYWGGNNKLTINDGAGMDLNIAGTFIDAKNTASLPEMLNDSKITVATGGIIRVLVEKNKKDGYASNGVDGLKEKIIWQHGAIFDWAVDLSFENNDIIYFPNAADGVIPVFRISGASGTFPEIGSGGILSINGLLEVNKNVTFNGAGQKTLRNGIIGSAALTMKADCGKMLINGATSIIGGTGAVVLNANGLDVSSAACTLISNKIINQNHVSGTMRLMSNATFIAQTFEMSGTAIFHQQDNAHLKTAHANGVSGSIQTNTYTHGNYCHFTFNGAANQITGARMPPTVGDVFIENSGTTGSNNNVSVTNTGLQTIQGNLTVMYGQMNLNSTAGADLLLHGNFTRYTTGFYNDNNRVTSFTGSKDSYVNRPLPPPVSVENPTLQDFGVAIIDKANGFKVILNTPTGILKKLTLINGIIDAEANGLYIKHPVPDGADDGVTGGNTNSYVSGALYRYMSPVTNGDYLFPVGRASAGKFRPVKFSSTTKPEYLSPGAVYKAEFWGDINTTPSRLSSEYYYNTLQGILKDEYWQFDKTQGSDSAKGKLAIAYTFPGVGYHWRDAGNGETPPPLLDATQCATCYVAVVKRTTDNGDGN